MQKCPSLIDKSVKHVSIFKNMLIIATKEKIMHILVTDFYILCLVSDEVC